MTTITGAGPAAASTAPGNREAVATMRMSIVFLTPGDRRAEVVAGLR